MVRKVRPYKLNSGNNQINSKNRRTNDPGFPINPFQAVFLILTFCTYMGYINIISEKNIISGARRCAVLLIYWPHSPTCMCCGTHP